MKRKRCIIDVGSNSVRSLSTGEDGSVIHETVMVTQLGSGFDQEKGIPADAVERTGQALINIKDKAVSLGVPFNNINAFGTHILRKAPNSAEVIKRLFKKTGVAVQVLTGEDEALYSYIGACEGLGIEKHKRKTVVDVGGGSTEIAWGAGRPEKTVSIQAGALALTERFVRGKDGPFDMDFVSVIASEVSALIKEKNSIFPQDSELGTVVLCGGTACAAAWIRAGLSHYDGQLLHGMTMTLADIEDSLLSAGAAVQSVTRRYGLDTRRARILPAGICILKALFEQMGMTEAVISRTGLCHGILV